MRRTFVRTLGVALLYLVTSGHVGSPDTWFEGTAGPYSVTVQIQPAGVVPGVAKVFVRAPGATLVTIQANKYDATGGAPPPEPTESVNGDNGAFSGKLWIMSGGSNSVTVNITGPKGQGKVVVPIVITAFTRLGLEKPMGIGLAAMGLFLFAGLVTIVGAATREGSLEPGAPPTPRTVRRARFSMAITSVIVVTLLAGGWKWWNAEDVTYEKNMYKPLKSSVALRETPAGRAIAFSIAEPSWVRRRDTAFINQGNVTNWTPLIEDHGKLMHLFLISEDQSSFVHLHPNTVDTVLFSAPVASLPTGKYRVFADIVHESGFTHTLVSSLDVPSTNSSNAAVTGNPDDSWYSGSAAAPSVTIKLDETTSMRWTGRSERIVAGVPASLRFEIQSSDGSPVTLEPYMGMAGHAVVERNDGSVFVHLHPMGTISMASQMAFAMRQPGDSIKGQLGKRIEQAERDAMSHSPVESSSVSFPYAFPKAGDYHVWVQVKRGGKILTGAFNARVEAAPTAH